MNIVLEAEYETHWKKHTCTHTLEPTKATCKGEKAHTHIHKIGNSLWNKTSIELEGNGIVKISRIFYEQTCLHPAESDEKIFAPLLAFNFDIKHSICLRLLLVLNKYVYNKCRFLFPQFISQSQCFAIISSFSAALHRIGIASHARSTIVGWNILFVYFDDIKVNRKIWSGKYGCVFASSMLVDFLYY